MDIDGNIGDGRSISPEIEAVIHEIAAMVNKSNDNDWYEEAESLIRCALRTAFYNPKLLADILELLEER